MLARRAFLAQLACIAGFYLPVSAVLAAPAKQKLYLFNIPAQPLQSALIAYVNVVGVQIIYNSKLAQRHRSGPLVGLFTADTALRMLIEGTDLTIVSTGTQDITLASFTEIRAGVGPGGAAAGETTLVLDTLYVDVPPGAQQRPDFTEYGQLVRAEIRRALTKNPGTARRVYNMRIEIWIDSRGGVRRSRLVRSSGNSELDSAIERVLATISTGTPPPPGMPQPVRAAILGI